MTESSDPTHPTDETVAAYLEGVATQAERASLEKHLDDCEYCRARLVLAGHALDSAPRARSQMRWKPIVAAALAASLAGVLLLSRSAPEASPSPVRGSSQEVAQPAVRILAPLRGTTVAAATLRFVWSTQEPDALYQVTLSAADGRMLWTSRTADTAAAPPAEVLRDMQPGQPYFWRVDALLSNLRSLTSSDQRFQVSR
jgi:Putative zinc-finger